MTPQDGFFRKRGSRRTIAPVGLALGSGGARGLAHLGVLEVLKEAGVEVGWVAGSSMGALVGAVLCSGKMEEFRDVCLELDTRRVLSYFFEMKFPGGGLIDGDRLLAFLREFIASDSIEQLTTPFCAVSTDLYTGEEVCLANGDLMDAVRASISIPGIFTPVSQGGRVLVDGGLVNPVPVSACRQLGASRVIAVRVNQGPVQRRKPDAKAPRQRLKKASPEKEDSGESWLNRFQGRLQQLSRSERPRGLQWFGEHDGPGLFDVLGNSIRIVEAEISTLRLRDDPPDLLIDVDLGAVGVMDFQRVEEAMDAGRRAAEESLRHLGPTAWCPNPTGR